MGQSNIPSSSTAPKSMWKKPTTLIAIALIVIIIASVVTYALVFYKPASTGPVVLTGAGPRIRFLGFNIPTLPKDRFGATLTAAKYTLVRQAIAYSVNRTLINSSVFLGLATSIYSMIPPSMPYSQPVFSTTYGANGNITLAQNLLTTAGYNSTGGTHNGKLLIDLWYNSDGHYGDTEPSVALAVKTAIEKTNMVTVSLKSEPWAQYRTDLGLGHLPFYLLGWYPDYLDTDDYAAPFFNTDLAKGQGSYYSNATVDSWLKNEASAASDSLRAGNFTNIQNQSAKDVPYIPLWQAPADVEYRQGISGVYLHPVSFKYFVMSGTSTLNVGTTDSVVCLDPACAYDYFSIEVINQVFDTLLVYSPTNATLLPGLATQVPTVANGGISSDSMNYTYHLRQGVKFTDGTPFNATVMKWSIERTMGLGDPTSGNPYYAGGAYSGSAAPLLFSSANLGPVSYTNEMNANITVIDNYTIKFHLKQPTAFFNQIMAFSVSAPVSMSAYQKDKPQPDDVAHIVGTGPYKVSAYVVDKSVTFVANPNYYNPTVYSSYGIPTIPVIGTVTITHYSDATGLLNALKSGQIDMAYRTLLPTDVKALQG